MNDIIAVFGWFCLATICFAVAGFAVALAADLCRRAMERYYWSIDTKTRQEVGRSLGASAYWFSECPDAALAIRIVAERLASGGSTDADSMREQWRKGRAALSSGVQS